MPSNPTPRPDVLFVCVHNAGRSQMAAALFNREARRRGLSLHAESAGTRPGDHIYPEAVQHMAELGIDLSESRPKLLTDDLAAGVGSVFTMGCAVEEQTCPALFMRGIQDWGLPDPAGKPLEEIREIREQISNLDGKLLDALSSR